MEGLLHSNLALQAPSPAAAPLAPRSRGEILDRYRRFRMLSKEHNSAAVKRTPTDAFIEQARRLGIARGRTLRLNSEDELALVWDLVIYARREGRQRALDRYASSQQLPSDSDEARVLSAMLAARFAFVRVERRHPAAGLIVSDLLREEELWLVDEGLEATAPVGCTFATRLYAPEDFHMTAGVIVPLDRSLLASVLVRRPRLARVDLDELSDDRRFAQAIYREAIEAGVMKQIRFLDPPELAKRAG